MAYVVPNTRIKLMRGVNIPSDGKHTLYFADRTAQTNFFESTQGITFNDYSFQRGTDGSDRVRVGASYGSLYGCSYLLFNNESFLNKNFYAFITDIRYVNNATCDVYYRIDNLQTWMFDIEILPSYVERTMDPGNDLGLYTDEGLSPGEMELQYASMVNVSNFGYDTTIIPNSRSAFGVMIQTTLDLEKANHDNYPSGAALNDYRLHALFSRDGNMIDSIGLFVVPIEDPVVPVPFQDLDGFMRVYNWIQVNGFTDAVISMWVYPTPLLTYTSRYSTHLPTQDVFTVTGVKTDTYSIDVTLPVIPRDQNNNKLVNGLTVKNKKLTCYPFTQMVVSNNNGSAVSWKCELFTTSPDNPAGRALGTSTAEGKIRLVPLNYGENIGTSLDYDTSLAIDSAPVPFVSYTGDQYNIWLAQNRNTINNNFDTMENTFIRNQVGDFARTVTGIAQGVAGGASAFGAAGIGQAVNSGMSMFSSTQDAINQINAIVAQSEDMRQRPATASGVQSVGLSTQNGKEFFTGVIVQPRVARVRQLDDYFSMFGYRIDRVMPINLHVRTNWTYIKTAGCQIRSNIPKDIETQIANQFDNGIWFWSNNATMCDFSQSNNFLI